MAASSADRGQLTGPPAQARRRRQHPFDSLIAILRPPSPGDRQQALAAAIASGRIDWEGLGALAAEQLLLPALWPALREKNLVAPLPEAVRRFLAVRAGGKAAHYRMVLEAAFLANARRNESIRRQALAAIGTLNAAGIEPGLLKGTRLILASESPYGRSRILRDIDLLVPAEQWETARDALVAAGYRAAGEAAHALSLALDGAVEVDLHRQPLSLHVPVPLPDYLTPAGFWRRAESLAIEGRRCRCLPASENLVHAILHTEVADLNYAAGDWPLRYLHETAATSREQAIDWAVLELVEGRGLRPALRAHLQAARLLFAERLPQALADSLSRDWRQRRHFLRCRLHARHPRSLRRADILLYKLGQAMSPWYLRRKGYYGEAEGAGMALWRARLRALGDLARRHAGRLPALLFRARDSGVPPPRV